MPDNILFLMTDQHSVSTIGAYGNPFRRKLLANYERNVGYLEDLADGQFTYPGGLELAGWQLGLIGKWHGRVRRTAARAT
jgi:arylsulfatase A-like enzyme